MPKVSALFFLSESMHDRVWHTCQKGTDIAKETVDMIATETGFKANITSLQASDDMTKKLIDIVA